MKSTFHFVDGWLCAGESGAGKTETTKKAMQYFATLAGGTGVEGQVLEVGVPACPAAMVECLFGLA